MLLAGITVLCRYLYYYTIHHENDDLVNQDMCSLARTEQQNFLCIAKPRRNQTNPGRSSSGTAQAELGVVTRYVAGCKHLVCPGDWETCQRLELGCW